jgi:hypothetical protein
MLGMPIVYMSIEKCTFITQEFEYLDDLITTARICLLPSEMKAILHLKAPKVFDHSCAK